MSTDTWRRCSSCKREIDFGVTYWACNVSTCNRSRMALFFCSVPCWEAHLPTMRHRDSYAVEQRAPSREQAEREEREGADAARADTDLPVSGEQRVRKLVPAAMSRAAEPELPDDVLIVVSKLKKYIKARSGMSTSDRVVDILSDIVRDHCNDAIRRAAEDGRKTVLERDFARR
jgi:hypothetical protein